MVTKTHIKFNKKNKQAGAHAVKIQTYDENSMTFDSLNPIFLLKKDYGRNIIYLNCIKKQNPIEWHRKFFNMPKVRSIAFSTPFDEIMLNFIKIECSPYKIASFELVDHPLISL